MNKRRCRTCLYPDTKPDLHFDETGQCSACRAVEQKQNIDWDARQRQLEELLDRHHGEVIVPSSGGKDSHYQALRLTEMGAHVTAVTARTCHLTPVGRSNIDNLARYVRTIEATPNMNTRAKLNRLGLELVYDISWPEHAAIFSVPFRLAKDLGISLIMYGECPQREYGGPPGSAEAIQMTRRWVTEFGGFNGLRPQDFVSMKEGITSRDMEDYMPPKDFGSLEAHFLGAYEPWDSHHTAKIAVEFGMQGYRFMNYDGNVVEPPTKANWWEYENLDNAQTGLHDHFMFLKYGYGRGCAQISVDVRNGEIQRGSALDWVKEHDGVFPETYAGVHVGEVLDRIGITRARLDELMEEVKGV